MKKIYASFLVLLALTSSANNTFQKLCEVNKCWLEQKDVSENSFAENLKLNEKEWIRFHLMSVEQILRNRNVTHLSAPQKQNREKCLTYLHQYWNAGNFPINEDYTYRTPIFIDKHDNFCAVGYLVKASGHENISRMIASKTNLAYVHQMKYPELLTWANENGFTVDELAWIQPGYPPFTIYYGLDHGLNGAVNSIVVDSVTQTVYAGGSFAQTGTGIPCTNVAAWISGFAGWSWIPVGNGLNGTVHTLLLHNNKLYAGGDFTNHIAVYDIANGQWQSIGSLDSTVRAITVYNSEIYAGGDFTGNVSKWNGSSWQSITQSLIVGSVRALEVWDTLLVIGGNFELLTGAPRKNAVAYDGTQMILLGMGTLTPVNDFEFFDGKLLAGCDFVSGNDTCAIASFNGTNWQVYLKPIASGALTFIFDGTTINKMVAQDSTLLVGGDFICTTGSGIPTYGKNLMEYLPALHFSGDTFYDLCSPQAYLNNPVNTIALTQTDFFFGGDFTTYQHGGGPDEPLNHIASKNSFSVGINDLANEKMSVIIYPNPATQNSTIQITAETEFTTAAIFDISGRKISETICNSNHTAISTAGLAKGIYLLQLNRKENTKAVRKIIIQ